MADVAPETAARRVIVVVGAGRSGTSALTRGLAALGVELGDRLKPASKKNAKGFFEDLELIDVNYRLRDVFGLKRSGAGVQAVPEAAFERREIAPLHARAVDILRARTADAPLWGFKAGGVLSFLPFWESVFAAAARDASYVLALRHPLNVARSRAKVSLRRGVQTNSDLEFLARVVPYFRRAAQQPLVIVDYDRLLADAKPELARVAGELGLPQTAAVKAGIEAYVSEFLSPSLRHHAVGDAGLDMSERLVPLARDAYNLLAQVAHSTRSLHSRQFWDEWSDIEARHGAMALVLQHIDALEAQLRRSRQGIAGLPNLTRELVRRWRCPL